MTSCLLSATLNLFLLLVSVTLFPKPSENDPRSSRLIFLSSHHLAL